MRVGCVVITPSSQVATASAAAETETDFLIIVKIIVINIVNIMDFHRFSHHCHLNQPQHFNIITTIVRMVMVK